MLITISPSDLYERLQYEHRAERIDHIRCLTPEQWIATHDASHKRRRRSEQRREAQANRDLRIIERRMAIEKAQRRRWLKKCKPVLCTTLTLRFESIDAAARFFGVLRSTMSMGIKQHIRVIDRRDGKYGQRLDFCFA